MTVVKKGQTGTICDQGHGILIFVLHIIMKSIYHHIETLRVILIQKVF